MYQSNGNPFHWNPEAYSAFHLRNEDGSTAKKFARGGERVRVAGGKITRGRVGKARKTAASWRCHKDGLAIGDTSL
jgi:hypothetical protein